MSESKESETYITTPQLQERWADCSRMFIERRLGEPGFPTPVQPGGPGGRRLWPLSQIVSYEIDSTVRGRHQPQKGQRQHSLNKTTRRRSE